MSTNQVLREEVSDGVKNGSDEDEKHEEVKSSAKNATRAASTTGKLKGDRKLKKVVSEKIIFDGLQLCEVRKTIHQFYANKDTPTCDKVLETLQKDANFSESKEMLRRMVKKVGFRLQKCVNKRLLMEKNDIIVARRKHLKQIFENDKLGDKKRPVIYVGETSIQLACKRTKNWQDEYMAKIMKEYCWRITHAGSTDGFISGAYMLIRTKINDCSDDDEVSFDIFSKWISDRLLPNIPKNSLIVFDRTPENFLQVTKPPTIASRKEEIQLWLKQHRIPFKKTKTKSELLQIVKRHRGTRRRSGDVKKKYRNHEISRLPPFHMDLNPMEFIWKTVKSRVEESENIGTIEAEKSTINSVIANITEIDWLDAITRAQDTEAEYRKNDMLIEDNIDEIKEQLEKNAGDNSDCENSSDSLMDTSEGSDDDAQMNEETS